MAHTTPHLRLALTAAAAGALLLVGCNDDGGTGDRGNDPQGPTDTQEQAPTTVPSTVQGATGGGEGGGGRNDRDQPQDQTPQDDPGGTGDGGNTGAGSTDDWSSETDGRDAG
jgi:hypothetical protein